MSGYSGCDPSEYKSRGADFVILSHNMQLIHSHSPAMHYAMMKSLRPASLLLLAGFALPASAALPAGDAKAGKASFRICVSCHQTGPAARARFGPPLYQVLGRKAGSVPDFAYSSAMKNAGFVWTDEKLLAFMRAPGEVVPGNKMRFYGISNEQQLANILAYLRQQD